MNRKLKEKQIVKVLLQLPMTHWVAVSPTYFETKLDDITIHLYIEYSYSYIYIAELSVQIINDDVEKLVDKFRAYFDFDEIERIEQRKKDDEKRDAKKKRDDDFLTLYKKVCKPNNPRKTHIPATDIHF